LRRIGDIIGHTAAWSPDGETIAFARGSTLFKVNNDGTGLRKLIDTPGKPQKLRWSPQPGSQVLRFTIRAPDGHEATLWELQSGGMGLHPVLTAEGSGAGTALSNDDGIWISGGRYYLFRSLSASGYSIRAVRERGRFPGFSGEHTLQIHQTTSSIQALAPGPDGKRVYFISAQERRQLVRYNNARREFVPYLPGISGRWVAYSRDGKWVAYTTSAPETLWRSRPDGSDAVQLTQPPLRAFFPSWSADGAWIAFTGFPAGQTYGIYVIPSTGGIPQRLTPADSADDNPEWSPDGNRVMFHHSPPRGIAGPNGIYVIDWNTRKISPFMPAGKWHRGAWSPDGQHIAMTDGSQIDVLDARSRQLTHVASAKGIGRPLWSHNGRYVYYQDLAEAELPIFRAAIEGGRVERLMSLRQIPQSDLSAYILVSLAPDDTPIASILRTNSEVYALDLELP
jgi:Tol biopolymer transport system component